MFSPQTRHFFQNARGLGSLAEPGGRGFVGDRSQGHFFEVGLRVEDGVVRDLGFLCPRCLPAIACGGYLHHTLVGQPVARARAVTSEEILQALGGLPLARSFYAWMAAEALRQALGDHHAA